jgi:putative ABC transport system permease protein
MLKNYLFVAFRNIRKHKGFSFINIAGLTLGLTACLVIGLFVRDEKQFDKFVPEGEQIYRAYYEITGEEGTSKIATTPPMFATVLQQQFPEVEKTARVLNLQSKGLFTAGTKKMYEQNGILADPTFFDIFPLSFVHGFPAKALEQPNAIIISNEMAHRYFGNKNPVGKDILLGNDPFQIKGVFKNDQKFHLRINYILPMAAAAIPEERMQSWEWYGFTNYVKLKKGADIQGLQNKFQNYSRPFLKAPGLTYLPLFQPLHNIHLYSSDFKYDNVERGNITYVKALTIIAIFILLIACFNFVNLATAKSLQRAKEVGVRKAIGANRKQLLFQFLCETILLTFVSITLSIGLIFLLLPSVNNFTGKHIVFDFFTNPVILAVVLALTFVVGILAGFYPALVLSGFQPIKVLKGAVVSAAGTGKVPWLRHGLVIIQFSLSVLMIISAIVVIKQVSYLHNKDLGFNKDQVLFFPMRGENLTNNYESFKKEIQQIPGVSCVSVGYGFPGDIFGDGLMKVPRKGEEKKATQLMVDHDYIKTLGLKLIAGRDFSTDIKTDKDNAYIINETAVKDLGLGTPEDALGETLLWNTWRKPDLVKKGQVIGVVKDFHYKSLYDKVEPAVLQIYPEAYSKVAVKLRTAGIENSIASIKKVWNRFTPAYPIDYNFLDESFDQMYKADDKLKSLLWMFTAITIFVACLGLFGLAAYAAEHKKKEISIRKILGASVHGVVLLLSKQFIKLVIIAFFIASPIAWYLMNMWLQDFPYRVFLSGWIFIISGLLAIIIALATVSFQAIKAAIANPVKSLRTE